MSGLTLTLLTLALMVIIFVTLYFYSRKKCPLCQTVMESAYIAGAGVEMPHPYCPKCRLPIWDVERKMKEEGSA